MSFVGSDPPQGQGKPQTSYKKHFLQLMQSAAWFKTSLDGASEEPLVSHGWRDSPAKRKNDYIQGLACFYLFFYMTNDLLCLQTFNCAVYIFYV